MGVVLICDYSPFVYPDFSHGLFVCLIFIITILKNEMKDTNIKCNPIGKEDSYWKRACDSFLNVRSYKCIYMFISHCISRGVVVSVSNTSTL